HPAKVRACNLSGLVLLYYQNIPSMLYAAIALFALAAIFGLVIFKNWLTSAHTSRAVVYAHGIFAAIALVILLIFVLRNPVNSLQISVGLFVAAALGGFYMFFRDLKGKFSPMWLAVVHALIAVAGFGVLVFYVI
ncbi:MAG TPA: hypothetical protein VEB42_10775, partial [Chitinophagaceae bacterium]|nr:hypothetical protein [Chitinophagaceae bacterium]